jgi:hypothetical protein
MVAIIVKLKSNDWDKKTYDEGDKLVTDLERVAYSILPLYFLLQLRNYSADNTGEKCKVLY